MFPHGRALDLIADKLEVGAHFGIARREQRGVTVAGDGLAQIAGFELRVRVVEPQGGRLHPGAEDLVIGRRRLGKFAPGVKLIGRGKILRNVRRENIGGKEEDEPHGKNGFHFFNPWSSVSTGFSRTTSEFNSLLPRTGAYRA